MSVSVLSYPLLRYSLAFLAGIMLASRALVPWERWLWLCFGAGAASLLLRRSGSFGVPPAETPTGQAARKGALRSGAAAAAALFPFLFFLSLGGLRYAFALPRIDAHHIAWYVDRKYDLILTARLVQPPDVRDEQTLLRLAVESVDTGDEVLRVHGLILAQVPERLDFAYGDLLRLRGRLESPPVGELFSYRDYLVRRGIYAYMREAQVSYLESGGNPLLRLMFALRGYSRLLLHRFYPDPVAALLAGILLGDEGGLSQDWVRAFKVTGTSHIIAISGFNIAIIVALFGSFFGRLLGPRRGAAIAVLGVIFYTVLVGAEASVVRAAIMGTVGILGQQLYRRQVGLNTLAFTAALMALFSPFVLWDVGFQLSFFATLGLILFGNPLQQAAEHQLERWFPSAIWVSPTVQFLSDAVLLTMAAQITTLPIMAYHFQQISLIAFLANPFILPVQPAVMTLGGASLLFGWLWPPLGQVAAWIAWPFPAYTLKMVETFARFPITILSLNAVPLWSVIAYCAALLFWTFDPARRERALEALRRWISPGLLALAVSLISLALILWKAVFALPDGRLHLTFLDVGSADAILVRAPGSKWVLINGGPSANVLSQALGDRFSPFEHRLEWLIVASTQQEQLAALPWVLERYPPRQVLWAGLPQASSASRALDAWLTERGVPVTFAEAGQVLDLGQGATLEVVAAGERGAVLLVRWKQFRALLPIGLDATLLEELPQRADLRNVTLFSLPDSGYPALISEEWLAHLAPQVAILSVAADDPFGNPTPEVLKMLRPYSLLRTDLAGWIEVSTDGERMWLSSERPLTLSPSPAPGKGEDLYPMQ